jgi:hypothetical protein
MHGTSTPSLIRCAALCLALGALPLTAAAQSLTSGQLKGVVLELDGAPVSGAVVTLEDARGSAFRFLESDFGGYFTVALLAPGRYSVLVEQVGYQPIRLLNVRVAAGQATSITARLERRPPPIDRVVEIEAGGALAGVATGRIIGADDLSLLGRHGDLTDLSRSATEVDGPRDARAGLGASAGGLPIRWTRLMVDGVEERLLRHPGLPAEPAATPAFARDAVDQAQVAPRPLDGEWRGAPGALVSAQTRRGAGTLRLVPHASWSGANLGVGIDDNPADSTASSIEAGATLSGALIPDTLAVFLQVNFRSLQQPTAYAWEQDAATWQGAPGSLRQLVAAIAADSFGTAVDRFVQPTLRTWQGFSALGRLDWRLGSSTQMALRAAGASFEERAPLVGDDLPNGAGVDLDGRDLSVAAAVTTVGQASANELRIGVTSSRREYTTAQQVAATTLAHEGVGFGIASAFPATFSVTGVDFSDAFQMTMDRHQLKAGVSVGLSKYQQAWAWGTGGRWTFGGLSEFGTATGDWMQVTGTGQVDFNATQLAVFGQDLWQLSPDLQLLLGARYELQTLPADRLVSPPTWVEATGVLVDSLPSSSGGVAPRLGFVWDSRSEGKLVVRAGAGLHFGGADPALVAEALTFSGAGQVRRGQGSFASWPAAPSASLAPWSATRLTLFSEDFKSARTFKLDAGLTSVLAPGTTLTISGGYHHSDFLLRRSDLNLAVSSGTTQGGRPVFGQLVRQGGLVSPLPGSNRRFNNFDLVSGLVPDGYADYFELTTDIERRVTTGLTVRASYTFSRAEDNTTGVLSADPADQLNPFPDGLNGSDWTEGRSDLDVPHRLAVGLSWASAGTSPITVGARYRLRSGLPFTPGFRPGVDINGDGSGQNDPLFYGAVGGLNLTGCSGVAGTGFAVRNSCRGDLVSALDLSLAAGLPVGPALRLAVTVEAFNVMATATGLVDRAAVLVDPSGIFAVDPAGSVTIPFLANPDFGTLLSRRTDPRMLRVGLRLEY